MHAWLRLIGIACVLLPLWTAPAQAAETPAKEFSQARLDQMLAPIALYPDTVLSHILIAATYPLEVVEAARWTERNPGLEGENAVDAAAHKDWDPSVQALVAFPQILQRMSEDLTWTRDLGDAFLDREEDVIASIQQLRERAWTSGHLQDQEHIHVQREREVIIIEPAVREVVYVPRYDTRVVYGSWWWPAHPPVYWGGPAYGVFYWGSGIRLHAGFHFSSFHWPQRRVVVVHHHHHRTRHVHSGRDLARHPHARHWRHDPHHRRGVAYRSPPPQKRIVTGREQRSHTWHSDPRRAQHHHRHWAAERREQQARGGSFRRQEATGGRARRGEEVRRQSETSTRRHRYTGADRRSEQSAQARVHSSRPVARSEQRPQTRESRREAAPPPSAPQGRAAPTPSAAPGARTDTRRWHGQQSSRREAPRSESAAPRHRPPSAGEREHSRRDTGAAPRHQASQPRGQAQRGATRSERSRTGASAREAQRGPASGRSSREVRRGGQQR